MMRELIEMRGGLRKIGLFGVAKVLSLQACCFNVLPYPNSFHFPLFFDVSNKGVAGGTLTPQQRYHDFSNIASGPTVPSIPGGLACSAT